jgi:PAS domain S-box-containing protein
MLLQAEVMSIRLSTKIILLVMVPITIELLFVTILIALYAQLENNLQDEVQGRKLVSTVSAIKTEMLKGTDALGGFLRDRDPQSVVSYHQSLAAAKNTLATLKTLAASNQAQKPNLDKIGELLDRGAQRAERLVNTPASEDPLVMAKLGIAANAVGDELIKSLNSFGDTVQEDLDQHISTIESQRQSMRIALLLGVLVNIIMAPVAAILVSSQLSKRLSVLIDNSHRIASNKRLPAPLSGDDEISQLDQTLRTLSSELNLMMRQQRTILDNTSEIVCSINEGRNLHVVNPAVEAILGYHPEELMGARFLSLIAPEDADATTRALDAAQSGEPQTFENRVVKVDGQSTTLLWSVRWVDEEKSYFCVAHDISERKELEQLKQKVVSIVSHDLRSPLMSMQIKLKTLSDGGRGPLSEEVVEDLRRAGQNIATMIILTNDLLDLERLRAGNLVMRFRKRSVLTILNESVQSIQALIDSKGVRVTMPKAEIIVIADGERLAQVVTNFLVNAVKFSPPGRPVEIQARAVEDQLEVAITDYGPGISASDQAIIFQRFQQGDQHGSKTKGSGLGLAICKEIVEAHGGEVGVSSELGRGSTFWFRIPLKQASSHAVV